MTGSHEVRGSIPLGSTNPIQAFTAQPFFKVPLSSEFKSWRLAR